MAVHDRDVEALERAVKGEAPGGDTAFERRQGGATVRAGQGPGLGGSNVDSFGGLHKLLEELDREERHVGRHDHSELAAGKAQARRDTDDRCPVIVAVVVDGKRKGQRISRFADDDRLAERLVEDAIRALGERLAAEARERFRRPEPSARAADEQNPSYAWIRQGSE